MIDRELVTRKLALITGDLNEVGALAGRSPDEYLTSVRDELVAERLLERMVGRPDGWMDGIDPAKVYEALQAAVRDIPEYLRHIHHYVDKYGSTP